MHLSRYDKAEMMNDDDYLTTERDFQDTSVSSGHHLKQRNSCFVLPAFMWVSSHAVTGVGLLGLLLSCCQ